MAGLHVVVLGECLPAPSGVTWKPGHLYFCYIWIPIGHPLEGPGQQIVWRLGLAKRPHWSCRTHPGVDKRPNGTRTTSTVVLSPSKQLRI